MLGVLKHLDMHPDPVGEVLPLQLQDLLQDMELDLKPNLELLRSV